MAEITLNVKMLGGFSVTCNGQEVMLGRNSAKFMKLLQIVWLAGDRGISRAQLVSRLYSDQELLTNLGNSLNNLFYQMRKQMVKSGLPDYEYITKKENMFYIDEKTKIITDVVEFMSACSRAEKASDPKQKKEYYTQAFELYTGELLPESKGEIWVVTDSALLHKVYTKASDWLGNYLRDQKNYLEMYRVYERAAYIYPDDDWQIGQIDSLVRREMYKEAYDLYDRTVRHYKEDLGIQPTGKLTECYTRMINHLESAERRLRDMQDEIISLRPEREGAYYCTFPGFVDCYHLLSRTMKRSDQPICVMLCTLLEHNGRPITNRERLKQRSAELTEIIKYALRYGDAFCKYSDSQFLILLTGSPYEGANIVANRIKRQLREKMGDKVVIKCHAASIAEMPEQKEVPWMNVEESLG